MAERRMAHCKKHPEYEPLCPTCVEFDERLERSFEVVHAPPARHRKFKQEEAQIRPPARLDEWAQSMVEAAAARKKAAEAPPTPVEPTPEEES